MSIPAKANWKSPASEGGKPITKIVILNPGYHVFLNKKRCRIEELRLNDVVSINAARDDQGRTIQEVWVYRPIYGAIANVFPGEYKLEVLTEDDNGKQSAQTITLKNRDRVYINEIPHIIDDLQVKDDVVVRSLRDDSGQSIQEVRAYRPDLNKGHIKSLKADEGKFMLAIDEGDEQGKEKSIIVPGDLEILLNGKRESGGKPVRLADLRAGDKVDVSHIGAEQGRKATKLKALRVVETKGVLTDDYDAASRLLSITTGTGAQSQVVKFPFAEQYIIAINGQPAAKPDKPEEGR